MPSFPTKYKLYLINEIKHFFGLKRSITLLILFVALFISSCATQKSRSDAKGTNKFYHDVTSKFNGYFNANELYKSSIISLEQEHQDNYNKILPIYKYTAVSDGKSVASNMDEAIKKVSIVATLHRQSHWTDDCYLMMAKAQYLKKDYESAEETLAFLLDEFNEDGTIKKKKGRKKKKKGKKTKKERQQELKEKREEAKRKAEEREEKQKERQKTNKQKKKDREKERKAKIKASKKAKKQREKEREQARKDRKKGIKTPKKTKEEKSKTIVEEQTKEDKKKKEEKEEEEKIAKKKDDKKENNEPENYFLKHKPAFQDAMLWSARTYIERDKFDEAARKISQLKKDPKTLDDTRKKLAPVEADLYLKQKKYAEAIEPLQRAVSLTKKKKERARYSYIIAQLYQKLNDGENAYAYFEKAKKLSPDYEMQFSARLNMEQNAWLNGKATAEQAVKTLNKMLKDSKNTEFKDQIYYAIANIALKQNDKQEAIKNLRASLDHSTKNQSQRAESYLLLAQLYYDSEEYVDSKNYYDSTLIVMSETDERHPDAKRFANSLTDIAQNIQIIELQDSLIAISQLDDKAKRKLAAKLKEENAKNAPASTPKNPKFGGRPSPVRAGGGGSRQSFEPSTFFAYNDKSVRKGKKNFERQWGSRTLEDDWRRSNRRGARIEDNQIAVENEDYGGDITDKELDALFKDVPKDPAERAAAEQKISDAMFRLGTLYRDRLENHKKTVETLGGLENRFPGNPNELDAWYYQYLSYSDLSNSTKKKEYMDKIIKKYATSDYANILQNPNAINEMMDEEQKLMNYYKLTYSDFSDGNFQQAHDKVLKAKDMFGEKNALQPKFSLLYAMCVGNLKGKGDYVKSLKEVVAKFPDTEEQTRAKEILRLLGELKEDRTIPKEGGEEGRFKIEDKKVHYIIVVLDGTKIKLGDAKIAVSDYNREFHKSDKLRISNIYLGADTDTPILVIRRFKKKENAVKYYEGVMKDKKNFLGKNNNYEVFAVTQHNYREILKSKSLDGYREFFEENYKK